LNPPISIHPLTIRAWPPFGESPRRNYSLRNVCSASLFKPGQQKKIIHARSPSSTRRYASVPEVSFLFFPSLFFDLSLPVVGKQLCRKSKSESECALPFSTIELPTPYGPLRPGGWASPPAFQTEKGFERGKRSQSPKVGGGFQPRMTRGEPIVPEKLGARVAFKKPKARR